MSSTLDQNNHHGSRQFVNAIAIVLFILALSLLDLTRFPETFAVAGYGALLVLIICTFGRMIKLSYRYHHPVAIEVETPPAPKPKARTTRSSAASTTSKKKKA